MSAAEPGAGARTAPSKMRLADLVNEARWTAWSNVLRKGKMTKVPFSAPAQESASDEPATWIDHDAAAAVAKLIVNGTGGGVGVFLGPAADYWLAGVDLDTCRDPDTGKIADWALRVIDRFGSYTEVSPSGTGAKIYFLIEPTEIVALRRIMGPSLHGRQFKRPSGSDHPPGIELYISHRYFAVTWQSLDADVDELRCVPLEDLRWLIEEAGPAFAGKPERERASRANGTGHADDVLARLDAAARGNPQLAATLRNAATMKGGSRSEGAMGIGAALRRSGWSFVDMKAALLACPSTQEWAREKLAEQGDRQFQRIWDAAAPDPSGSRQDCKRPLAREVPCAPPFPVDALGPLRKAAEALQEIVRVPLAIAAQSVLGAATLAAQPHRDVQLPGAGCRPLTNYFLSVAESGERKTTCDRRALRAVTRFEQQLHELHRPALAAFQIDHFAWKAACEHARKSGKGDRKKIRDHLQEIGPEPKAPPYPMLLVKEPSSQALEIHLVDRAFAGQFTDEGAQFIGGHAMSDDHRMRTGALLNSLWDGSPIRRMRVGTGTHFLPGRRCAVHIMLQPNVASRFLSDSMLQGIGTLARFLVSAPDTAAGTRFFRDPSPVAEEVLADYEGRLTGLLTRAPRTSLDDPCVLEPLALTLTSEASAMYKAFHDRCERALRPDGELAQIRPFASKMAEHAGRLAGVLAFYADPEAMDVSAEHMAGGITLAEHYANELVRLGAVAAVAPDLRLAQRLLEWWQRRSDPRCHLAAIYQRGLNAIGDAATARRIVGILEEHNWVLRLPSGTEIEGTPRRDAWELVP